MAIQAETLEVQVRASGVDTTVRDINRVPSAANKAASGVETAGTRARRGGAGFTAAGALVKAAAGTMLVSMGGKMVMAASDLEEQMSKTGVVFGKSANDVVANADRMADRFGIAKSVTLEAAGGIGLVAKASGLAEGPAAKLSNRFAQLGADASSFYNVPMEEALLAIKSGLVGEAEPMRRFGVLLSEAAVQSEAVRLGLANVGDELTEGQKVQARSSLIIKGMSDASGDLARTQDSVANRLREAQGRITNYAAELGSKALPVVADFLEQMIEAAPAIEKFARGIWDEAQPALNTLVDVAKTAVNAGKSLYDMFQSLPGPIQDLGAELGLAALVVPRVIGPLGNMATGLSGLVTQFRSAEGRASAFQRAMSGMKFAGAIGGVTLLADASQKAGTKVATLENVAGGALLGFAAGGPIGAALGAGAGLLQDLSSAADASWESMKEGMKFQQGYRDSLNQTNAAITEQTRRIAFQNLQNSEALKVGRLIGIKDRDLVSASLGNADALKRVTARVRELTGSQKELANAKPGELFFNKGNAQSFIASLKNMGVELDKDQRALLRANEAVQKWNQALKGVPKSVRTELKAEGYDISVRQLRTLQRQYDLTPKQVRTIVEATGMKGVRVDAEGNIRLLKELGRQNPKPKADLSDAQIKSKTAAADRALKALGGYTANPRANLVDGVTPVAGRVRNTLDNLDGKVATTYVRTIFQQQGKSERMLGGTYADGGFTGHGAKYDVAGVVHKGEFVADAETTRNARGLLEELHRTRGRLVGLANGGPAPGTGSGLLRPRPGGKDDVRESVRKGTKDGQKEAEKDRKPRKMDPEQRKQILGILIEIRDLKKELAVKGKDALGGLERKRAQAELAAANKSLREARKGPEAPEPEKPFGWGALGNMADGIKRAIDGSAVLKQFREIIRKNTKGQEEKALLNLKSLDRLGKKNDTLAQVQRDLASAIEARDAIRGQADSFRTTVQEGMSRQANVLNSGRDAGNIAASLGVQVGKAQEFAAAIQALRQKGYSDGIVMQVAAAGTEGGLEVAKALLAATPGEAQAITQSFNTIAAIAQQASAGVTGQMFDTGIQAAEGVVAGLEAREAKIEKTLIRIAEKIARVLRKRLKVKSPSLVAAEIGGFVGEGLVVGLNNKERRIADKASKIGSVLAAGLQTGVGTGPSLPASLRGTQGLTPAALGAGHAAGGVTFQFQTYNPVAEPESRTTNKALDRVASLSLV